VSVSLLLHHMAAFHRVIPRTDRFAHFKYLVQWDSHKHMWGKPEPVVSDREVLKARLTLVETPPFGCIGRCGQRVTHGAEMSEPVGDYVFFFRTCQREACIRKGMDKLYEKLNELQPQGE